MDELDQRQLGSHRIGVPTLPFGLLALLVVRSACCASFSANESDI